VLNRIEMDHKQVVSDITQSLCIEPEFLNELQLEGGAPVLFILQKALTHFKAFEYESARVIVEHIVAISWEKIHTGHWTAVAIVWRDVYSYGRLLMALWKVIHMEFAGAIKDLDLALWMGGPLLDNTIKFLVSCTQQWAYQRQQKQAANESEKLQIVVTSSNTQEKRQLDLNANLYEVQSKRSCIRVPVVLKEHNVDRVSFPSMETFYRDYMKLCKPVIITDAMSHWPSLNEHNWNDVEYFKKVAGLRTVPVEVGKTYLDDQWGQKLMTLNEFIDNFVINPRQSDSSDIGYLAQTQLFDQIPELRKDIFKLTCGSL